MHHPEKIDPLEPDNPLPVRYGKASNWIAAFNAMSNAVLFVDERAVIQFANPVAVQSLHTSLVGKSLGQVLHQANLFKMDGPSNSTVDAPLKRALNGEWVTRELWQETLPGGERVIWMISAAPILEIDQISGAVMVWDDVTALFPSREKLQTSEQWMRQFMDAVPEAMFLLDEKGTILTSNRTGATALGSDTEKVVGKSFYDLLPTTEVEFQKKKLENCFITGLPDSFTNQTGKQYYDEFIYPISDRDQKVKSAALFVVDMTPYRKMQADLRASEERYRNLVENISDVVFQLDMKFRFTYVSPVIEQSLQYKPEHLLGQELNGLIYPEDQKKVLAYLQKCKASDQRIEFRMIDQQRHIHIVSISFRPSVNHNAPKSITGIMTDITDYRRAEEALRYREERFRSLIEQNLDIILIINMKGKIDYASPSVENVLGYKPEEIIGKQAITFVHADDYAKVMQAVRYGLYTADFGRYIEFRAPTKKGDYRVIEAIGQNLVDSPAVGGVVINARDITERRLAEEKLWYLSTHDTMTDLYNRAYFSEEMNRIERGRIFPISIFIADVDGLKEVNDNQGHSAGDELLQKTAELLRNSFRTEDVVARIGGDEFAVLLPGADETAAQAALTRVRRNMQTYNEARNGVPLSLSMGVATGKKGYSLSEVLRLADENMYTEKLNKLGRRARGTGPLSGQVFPSNKTT